MDLLIPNQIQNQVNYLLKRFPKIEWSGPAWYQMITQDEETMWKIVYFIPIDLGSHGSTEFNG